MTSYYPTIIGAIDEFKAIIDAEYPEIETLNADKETVMNNSYAITMDESRVAQWEQALEITPLSGSSVNDRRDVIVARLKGQGKLNTALINTIVKAFTGGSANSWFDNDTSTLHIEITPPPDNKSYRFESVEQELQNKVPAHIILDVSRNYYTWDEVYENFSTWQIVQNNFTTWEDVYTYVPTKVLKY